MADLAGVGPGYEILPGEVVFPLRMTTDPAAGAELSVTVPGDARWEILGARVQLVTDATVANRRPALVVSDGTDEWVRAPVGTDVPASTTAALSWFRGAPFGGVVGANGAVVGPAPEVPILGGFVISTVTALLAAGDNYGRMTLYVRETSARGAKAQAELFSEVLRELLRRAHLEDVGGADPLAALLGRIYGVSVWR